MGNRCRQTHGFRHYLCNRGPQETDRLSCLSPQTITGLLQEFDVQASTGCGLLPVPCPISSPLFLLV